ncbi:MAG: hypothetical protein LIO59_06090 [Oscillospiraceae bacterium]|nr:hypothetical protein [Oscillospiraceae bacterium]
MGNFLKYSILFALGGIFYLLTELLWRGYSHWSMFVLGGLCFVLIGIINEFFTFDIPLFIQMIIGAFIITALEFITGCIVNLKFHLNVWNYYGMPMNIMGQICLPYTLLWFLLSPVCIIVDDYLRYMFFDEEKPHYKFF